MFEFQDRITKAIVTVVAPQIEAAEVARARRLRPDSLEAQDVYLRYGEKTRSGRIQDYDEALVALRPASERFPDDPRLLVRAADALEHRVIMGWRSLGPDDREMCLDFARRRLRLAGMAD